MDRTVTVAGYVRQRLSEMTDRDIAQTLLVVSGIMSEIDGGAMFKLWCDNHGACRRMTDDEFDCTEDMRIECALRYLNRPFMECANCGYLDSGDRCICESSQWFLKTVAADNYCGCFQSKFAITSGSDDNAP